MAKADPGLSTSATSGTAGDKIHDVASVTGVANVAAPTGTVTFKVYAPSDTSCTTPVVTFASVPETNGSWTSPDFTTTQAGTYHRSEERRVGNDCSVRACTYGGQGESITTALGD